MASDEERLSQYKTLRRIGAGRFGEVFQVQHKLTGELFCHKVVAYKGLTEKEKEQLVMEVNVMRDLKHPNIVRYVDRVVDRSKHLLYIVMEYCDSGDLAENMRQFHKHYEKVNEQVIFDIALQLLFALAYCHNSSLGPKRGRILHRDLKPQNIFLHSNNKNANQRSYICKVGDFGLCRSIGMESFAHSCVGTPYYWCPELLLSHNKKYDDKMDMWALGCVLYELSSGKTPFHKATTLAELAQKMKQGVPLPLPGRSRQLNTLLFALLQPDPSRRASAIQCLGLRLWDGPVSDWFWETVTPRDRENIYNNIMRRASVATNSSSPVVRSVGNVEPEHPRTPTTQKSNTTFRTTTNFEDSEDEDRGDCDALKKTPSVGTMATPDSQDTPLSCSNMDIIAYSGRIAKQGRQPFSHDHMPFGTVASRTQTTEDETMDDIIDHVQNTQECMTQRPRSESYGEDHPRMKARSERTPSDRFQTPTHVLRDDKALADENVQTVYAHEDDCDNGSSSRTNSTSLGIRTGRRYLPIFRDETPSVKRVPSKVPHTVSNDTGGSTKTAGASSRMRYIKEKPFSK
ncbi:serine/threonine-protein kinase NEK like protein [Babesia gibsoni]|uniref:non-specific serine/threonine protein kinase n=1 Tax=Babesia gibsoni TaxID=33632 RepID=A0AAD8PEQ0_BABGI|nr:serine/threonine-protein kinase NEK like protein [Babesia gibsoni]